MRIEQSKEDTEKERQDVKKNIEEWKDKKVKLFKKNDRAFQMIGLLIVVSGIVVSLYYLPIFREYALQKSIQVASLKSILLWSFIGFIFHYIGRKIFFSLTNQFFRKRMHPKMQTCTEDQKQQKLINLIKQTYQGFFHLFSALFAFYYFKDEIWFPQMIGGHGEGTCNSIFIDYPHMPQKYRYQILYFYQFQLGTYIYFLLDLILFDYKRYKSRNFGELFFHHFIALFLISISVFQNLIPIGVTVQFVHDASDFLRGFSRTFGETTLAINRPLCFKVINYLYFGSFVYFRLITLPFCLIESMYINNPSQYQQLNFLAMHFAYLIITNSAIYCIQCHWAYFIYFQIPIEIKKNQLFVQQKDMKQTTHIKQGEQQKQKRTRLEQKGDKKEC